jgi:hypothetical protein
MFISLWNATGGLSLPSHDVSSVDNAVNILLEDDGEDKDDSD